MRYINLHLHYITATKFRMVIKLDVRKVFARSTTSHALAKIFGDTNAGARSAFGTFCCWFFQIELVF